MIYYSLKFACFEMIVKPQRTENAEANILMSVFMQLEVELFSTTSTFFKLRNFVCT